MGILNTWLGKGKTLLGVIGAIATFVLVVVNSLQNGFQFDDIQTIIGGASVLMIAIGLGHKAEKILSALGK